MTGKDRGDRVKSQVQSIQTLSTFQMQAKHFNAVKRSTLSSTPIPTQESQQVFLLTVRGVVLMRCH